MKNTKLIALLIATSIVSAASAYYDSYGTWHDDVVTQALDTVTGGRYSDTPQDKEARIKATRELEDKKRSAHRKYADKEEKIQRKKEDRRNR